jgi:hypothetical protein
LRKSPRRLWGEAGEGFSTSFNKIIIPLELLFNNMFKSYLNGGRRVESDIMDGTCWEYVELGGLRSSPNGVRIRQDGVDSESKLPEG